MLDDQEPIEKTTHRFTVEIWLEEATKWRGQIRHALNGEKRSISDLADIIQFILPYLQKMGVRISWTWRSIAWLRKTRRRKVAADLADEDEAEDRKANS